MKALRHLISNLLLIVGVACLVVLLIPVLAAGAFVLRAVFLLAVPVALLIGVALWFTSERFRSWMRTTGTIRSYKGLRFATDVTVDRSHAWTRSNGRDVTIGVDDLMATALGPLDKVELPPLGRSVLRGDTLFRLQHGTRAIDVRAPIAGTISACNAAVRREPGLVNDDPFRRGWTVRMRLAPGGRTAGDRPSESDAFAWYKAEIDRALETISGRSAGVPAMADGGVISADIYQRIDEAAWEQMRNMWEGARS